MNWLSRVFGTAKDKATRQYLARDNKGTRYQDARHARAVWSGAHLVTYTPVVIYRFPTLDAAQRAIHQLSYIHQAADTGELISDEVIEFGCYRNDEGQGEVIICGTLLTHGQWLEAKTRLAAAGGALFREQEPRPEAKSAAPPPRQASNAAGVVTFVNEHQKGMNTYRVHRGPSKAAAMAFLQAHPVNRNFFYLVVETPEGNFGRDVDGIYAE